MTENLTVFEHLFYNSTSANTITVIFLSVVTKLISSVRTFQILLCQEWVKTLFNSLILGKKSHSYISFFFAHTQKLTVHVLHLKPKRSYFYIYQCFTFSSTHYPQSFVQIKARVLNPHQRDRTLQTQWLVSMDQLIRSRAKWKRNVKCYTSLFHHTQIKFVPNYKWNTNGPQLQRLRKKKKPYYTVH